MHLKLLFSLICLLNSALAFGDISPEESSSKTAEIGKSKQGAGEQAPDSSFLIGVSKGEIEQLIAVEIRTGGDTVYCQETGSDPLQGYYTLDSLIYRGSNKEITTNSLEDSLLRIVNQLSLKMPLMAKSLNEFIVDMKNPHNLRQKRIWWAVDNLTELKKYLPAPLEDDKIDESEFDKTDLLTPPKDANCYHKDETTGKIELNTLQTVIRRQDLISDRIVYLYRPEIMDQLSPLQRSYLLIHEWLWDFYSRGQINDLWMMNQFLHSEDLDQLDSAGVWDVFKNLNIPASILGPRPSYSDTQLELGDTFSCLLHKSSLRCWGGFKNSDWAQPELKAPSNLAVTRESICVIDEGKVKCWGDKNPDVDATIKTMGKVRQPFRLVSSSRVMCAISLIDGTVCSLASSFPNYLSKHIYTATSLEDIVEVGNGQGCFIGRTDTVCEGPSGGTSDYLHLKNDDFRALGMGGWNTCYIDQNYETYCWSSGRQPKKPEFDIISFPTGIAGANNGDHYCFINDFSLSCNKEFNFDPNSKLNYMPNQVYKPKMIRGSGTHFCVLDELGVKCWGLNDYGQSEVPMELYPIEPQ